MIVSEPFEYEGRTLNRTYSDVGRSVRKIGTDEVYGEAVDVYPCPYEYEETDMPLDDEEISNDELAQMLEGVL